MQISKLRYGGFLLVLAMSLSACASTPELRSSEAVQVVGATELPPPSDAGLDRGYRVGAMDRIVVDVFGFQEITARRMQVDSSGRISVPLAGQINVLGKTPSEIETIVTQRLRAAHVRDPQVAVNVEESVSKFVTVDGQVSQPGNYPVIGEMTLMRAVASARGVNEYARLDDVVVFRTVDGQRMAALYNLGAIRRGMYADPTIYAQDIVVVGNSPARRMFRDIIGAAPLFVSPIIAILR